MRNKKIGQRWKALAGVLFCVFLAAGCGKSGGADWDPDKIVYVPEIKDLDLGEGYINQLQSRGNTLYALSGNYNEETGQEVNLIVKMDIVSGEQEQVELFAAKENEYFSGFFINEAGNFIMLSSVYGENGNQFFLYEVSPDGAKLKENEITQAIKGNGGDYIQRLIGDSKGNLYMLLSQATGSMMILALNEDGAVTGKVEHNDYINNLFCDDAGNAYITAWGTNGMAIKKVDFASKSVGAEIELENKMNSGNLTFVSNGAGGFLVNDSNHLYECQLETGKCEEILSWLDCDMYGNNISFFGVSEEGTIWTLSQTWEGETRTAELAFLNQTTADKLPKREMITYGSLWLDSDVQTAIIKFNKNNDKYKITVKEYGRDDHEAGVIQLNTDLTGANCPDIINLSNLNWEQLKNKGVLADLYPYMEKDENFRIEDYQENILKLYEADEKLYGILPAFTIITLAGSEKNLQGIDRWNIPELIEFAEKYPDAKLLNTTSGGILGSFISSNMEHFINWDTGECGFNNEEFIGALEFANTFDKELDYQSPDRIGTHEGLSTGKFILMDQYISSINEIQVAEALFDGPVKFIGYPSDEKSGIVALPSGFSYGMSARSKVKDGAWEFISYVLSDEYQEEQASDRRWGIPVKKAYIDKLCEKAMEKEYTTDENGKQVEVSNHTYGYDDIEIQIHAATEAQVAQFKELIGSVGGLREDDMQMYNIISEETESFFAGQKSAKEVADIIQSRMQIYVNENR